MPARIYKTMDEYRDAMNTRLRRKMKETRDEILLLLGNCCVKCKFDDRRALQIDHVNGNGYATNKTGSYARLIPVLASIRNGSTDYQILCANCNQIKKIEEREGLDGDIRMALKKMEAL